MTQTVCDGCGKIIEVRLTIHARDGNQLGDFEFCHWKCVADWAIRLYEQLKEAVE